jgi:hypothetical protein
MAQIEVAPQSQRALPRVLLLIAALLVAARITWAVLAPPEQAEGSDPLESVMRPIR